MSYDLRFSKFTTYIGYLTNAKSFDWDYQFTTILGVQTRKDLEIKFMAPPEGANKLCIVWHDGTIDAATELSGALQRLSRSLRSLSFESNDFSKLKLREVREIFTAVPATVLYLDLSHTRLGVKPAVLLNTLASVPPSAFYLNLGNTLLGNRSAHELRESLSQLPSTVKYLDLRANGLNRLSASDMKEVLSGLPDTVIAVDLSENDLGSRTAEQLQEIFSGLPKTLAFLSLRRSGFGLREREVVDLVGERFGAAAVSHLKAGTRKQSLIFDFSENGPDYSNTTIGNGGVLKISSKVHVELDDDHFNLRGKQESLPLNDAPEAYISALIHLRVLPKEYFAMREGVLGTYDNATLNLKRQNESFSSEYSEDPSVKRTKIYMPSHWKSNREKAVRELFDEDNQRLKLGCSMM